VTAEIIESKTVGQREDELANRIRRLHPVMNDYDLDHHYRLQKFCGPWENGYGYCIISGFDPTRENDDVVPGSIRWNDHDAFTLKSTGLLTLKEAERWADIQQEATEIRGRVVRALITRADVPFLAWRTCPGPGDSAAAIPLDSLFPPLSENTKSARRRDQELRDRTLKMLKDLPDGWRLTEDADGVPYFTRAVVGYDHGDHARFAQEPRC
jgi:hypothetical protein